MEGLSQSGDDKSANERIHESSEKSQECSTEARIVSDVECLHEADENLAVSELPSGYRTDKEP